MENILLERFPKINVEIQTNCENKEKHVGENQCQLGSILSQLKRKKIEL